MKRTVPERVDEYVKKHPEAYNLSMTDVNQIRKLGNTLDIVCTAFAYGYMRASKRRKAVRITGYNETCMNEYQKSVSEKQEKSINFISKIDDIWILNQIYRTLVNITKDTKYERFVS